MARKNLFAIAVFTLCSLAAAQTESPDSSACYRIEPWMMIGIVAADVLLTLIIVVLTYKCATSRHQRKHKDNKVYMNVPAKGKG